MSTENSPKESWYTELVESCYQHLLLSINELSSLQKWQLDFFFECLNGQLPICLWPFFCIGLPSHRTCSKKLLSMFTFLDFQTQFCSQLTPWFPVLILYLGALYFWSAFNTKLWDDCHCTEIFRDKDVQNAARSEFSQFSTQVSPFLLNWFLRSNFPMTILGAKIRSYQIFASSSQREY